MSTIALHSTLNISKTVRDRLDSKGPPIGNGLSIDWLIQQGLTSPSTQYRLSGRRFTGQKTQPTVSKYRRYSLWPTENQIVSWPTTSCNLERSNSLPPIRL